MPYHVSKGSQMPMPAGIVAMSPWTDLTASGESYETNYEKDPLFGNTKDSLIYVNDYPGEHDRMDPYISPLFGSFKGFPPMLIQAGSIEMLLSDSVDAAARREARALKSACRFTKECSMYSRWDI